MNGIDRAAYIKTIVDQAPPLTTEQQARIRLLLQAPQTQNGPGPVRPGAATDIPSPKETAHDAKPARAA